MPRLTIFVLLALLAVGAACEPAATPAAPEIPVPRLPDKPLALGVRGRQIYMSNCIVCHNPDPNQAGALGPDIAGSSRELVEARVLRNEYPEGYRPKRETRAMIPLPHLEPEIDALVAFLGEAATPAASTSR
jgi:mono/diheme cytochrome c family protein